MWHLTKCLGTSSSKNKNFSIYSPSHILSLQVKLSWKIISPPTKYIKPSTTKWRRKGTNSLMKVEELRNNLSQLTSQSSLITKFNLQHIIALNPRLPFSLISQGCNFVAVDLLFLDTVIDGPFIPFLTRPRWSVGIVCRERSFRAAGFRCRCWGWWSLWWRCWSPPWCLWCWTSIAWSRCFGGVGNDTGVVLRAEARFGEGIVCRLELCEAEGG